MIATKDERFWKVYGVSWQGRVTRRSGKVAARCDHKHATRATAARCLKRMQQERPGKCQDYRAIEVVIVTLRIPVASGRAR